MAIAEGIYKPLDHLEVNLAWGLTLDNEGQPCPGNFVLGIYSNIHSENIDKPNGYISGGVDLGLGLFDLGPEALKTALIGQIVQQNWLMFYPETVLVSPTLAAGFRIGRFGINTRVKGLIGIPAYDTEERENQYALSYSGSLVTTFGDYRGGLVVHTGINGLKHLNAAEEHSFMLHFNADLFIGSLGLIPYVGFGIPLSHSSADINLIVLCGVGWRFSVADPTF
jgi:hypothetical protein